MGTLFLNQFKKQASSFLQERYKNARLTFTDVTQAELLAEEATNDDPWGPDARTMTRIADAAFHVDNYWRIVDVLHRRLYSHDWKQWRQSYKSLVLLEFLITHGPEVFAEEFQSDTEVIEELGSFKYIDEKGFNWGATMEKRSDEILNLLRGGKTLKQARLKALKITREIQGFGNSISSPSSTTTTPSSSSSDKSVSSFSSYGTTSSTWNDDTNELSKTEQESLTKESSMENDNTHNDIVEGLHVWDSPPTQERGTLLDSVEGHDHQDDKHGLISGLCSKMGISPRPAKKYNGDKIGLFRNVSDVGRRGTKSKFSRQFSMGH